MLDPDRSPELKDAARPQEAPRAYSARDLLFQKVLTVTTLSAVAFSGAVRCTDRSPPLSEDVYKSRAQAKLLQPNTVEKHLIDKLEAKQKADEGKQGKKDAAPETASAAPEKKAAAPVFDPNRREEDRAKVVSRGLLSALNGASGGDLKGALGGDAHGVGGLGSRGLGPAGGGNGLGLGGLGTKGGGRGGGGLGNSVGLGSIGTGGRGGMAAGYGSGAGVATVMGKVGSLSVGHGVALGGKDRRGYIAPAEDPSVSAEPQKKLEPNAWVLTSADRLSTFGADVDTASYTEARRAIREGRLPEAATVRPEEFVNYFRYDYPGPKEGAFAVHTDLAPSPFEPGVDLLRVGVQAKRVSVRDRKVMHLTFLVDVSGSMNSPDRLPLAKESLKILLGSLLEHDTVSLVTYAGGVAEVLPPTPATERERIRAAIDSLQPGGGTAMGSGMQLAFRNAVKMLRPGEVSRVIVLTDGDANIGNTSHAEILKSIASYVKEGVTLSTIGFGAGNYRDEMLEQLADKGNGNNFYVDSIVQARRLFQEQLAGMLEVVAKDLKLQVEFDPAAVKRYRLIGYENRDIADKDFRNDRVDSGDVGAGHAVTALYAVELAPGAEALATVRVRAKAPSGEVASEQAFPVTRAMRHPDFAQAPRSFRLAVAAAGFADVLRGNPHASYADLERVAESCEATDADARELRELIHAARKLGSVASR